MLSMSKKRKAWKDTGYAFEPDAASLQRNMYRFKDLDHLMFYEGSYVCNEYFVVIEKPYLFIEMYRENIITYYLNENKDEPESGVPDWTEFVETTMGFPAGIETTISRNDCNKRIMELGTNWCSGFKFLGSDHHLRCVLCNKEDLLLEQRTAPQLVPNWVFYRAENPVEGPSGPLNVRMSEALKVLIFCPNCAEDGDYINMRDDENLFSKCGYVNNVSLMDVREDLYAMREYRGTNIKRINKTIIENLHLKNDLQFNHVCEFLFTLCKCISNEENVEPLLQGLVECRLLEELHDTAFDTPSVKSDLSDLTVEDLEENPLLEENSPQPLLARTPLEENSPQPLLARTPLEEEDPPPPRHSQDLGGRSRRRSRRRRSRRRRSQRKRG